MTDHTPDNRRRETFDTMIERPFAETTSDTVARPSWRRWALPTTAITLAVLGVGALAAAALTPPTDAPAAATTEAPASAPSRTPMSVKPTPASPTAASAVADRPVAELADPTWAARMAEEGDIPERAMVAYAGAALAAAEARPGCGIGWNTLAAVGLVESEHGSINGATLNADGTVTPTIIGVPLDGNGTNVVRDTDTGDIDGDPTWDRAVGPMQFIPSTWATAAQDGNRDGRADIDNIDDAALATALYLCDVGGDLTVPANWISAIDAYNPSVDYNNRVADAATFYATLR